MSQFGMAGIEWLIFDYDDTLGGVRFPDGSIHPTADAYEDVILQFLDYMERKGFDGALARARQQEIDLTLIRKFGFSGMERFAESMVDTYRSMGGRAAEDEWNIFGIGMRVFSDYPYAPLEGALDMLNVCHKHYNIAIITKGTQSEQMRKLDESGVGSFADYIRVVTNKDAATWEDILWGDLNLNDDALTENSWAIGNSVKADINPLVERGFNGVYVKLENGWKYEDAELSEPYSGRMILTVPEAHEALPILVPTHVPVNY